MAFLADVAQLQRVKVLPGGAGAGDSVGSGRRPSALPRGESPPLHRPCQIILAQHARPVKPAARKNLAVKGWWWNVYVLIIADWTNRRWVAQDGH